MIKLGLYSVAYSGVWFDNGLSLEGFMERAKKFGFDGIEIDLKRPHGFPGDLDAARCAEIRAYADKLGLPISAVAGNNNFASPVQEHIENELLMLREQLRVAKDLGAPFLRVFSAWRGVTFRGPRANYDITKRFENFYDATYVEMYDRVKACLTEGLKWAEEAGVVMLLQNHPPLTDCPEVMYDIVTEINSPWLKCCLDAPNIVWEKQNDSEYVKNSVYMTGALQKHSHASGEFEVDENGEVVLIKWDPRMTVTNYPAFIKALKEIGYDGYINYEFCHIPRKHGKTLGIEYVDQQVELAVRYFRKLIAEC